MSHKSGFVNIIGSPNVGKSTLMNILVGEKLSIITSKAQTTRHRIQGIVNGDDFQIVYSDTPGIVDPAYRLHEGMMNFVFTAIEDADVLLVVVEMGEKEFKNPKIFARLQQTETPIVLVLNKIDISTHEEVEAKVAYWKQELPKAIILPVSALLNVNVDQVLKHVAALLPEAPAYFDKDEMTDKTERFFMSEIIREKIFLNYQQEIPYSCEVEIEAFKEEPTIVRIMALIYVMRESQKGILIGHKGAMLKKVGSEARIDMEAFLGKQVFLETHVKVSDDWRNNPRQLKKFGYLPS